jgi:predicted nucleic acid-binding protein
MIVLDTNVVSEAMKPHCDPAVKAWLYAQVTETLFLTATSLAELLLGIASAPPGKRRDLLEEGLHEVLDLLFAGRVLAYTEQAAKEYARTVSSARAKGRPIAVADGQIGAIAAVHGFTVATRDTGPFEAAGVPVFNPWEG